LETKKVLSVLYIDGLGFYTFLFVV